MSHSVAPDLGSMVRKLAKRSPLGGTETAALLHLPYRTVFVSPRDFLIREGGRSDSCCVILLGWACRSKLTGGGDRQILGFHLRGDLIDLENSLSECAAESLQVLTRSVVAYIPRAAILELAAEHPAIARALWRDSQAECSISREWILNIGQRDSRQRIAHLLCELAERQEAAELAEGPHYAWPITQEQLGDATGLTGVHVNRTVQGLRADGLIKIGGGTLTILDRRGLEAAGDFSGAYLQRPARRAA